MPARAQPFQEQQRLMLSSAVFSSEFDDNWAHVWEIVWQARFRKYFSARLSRPQKNSKRRHYEADSLPRNPSLLHSNQTRVSHFVRFTVNAYRERNDDKKPSSTATLGCVHFAEPAQARVPVLLKHSPNRRFPQLLRSAPQILLCWQINGTQTLKPRRGWATSGA